MGSDLKLNLVMTASQRGPNVQLMDNPAVLWNPIWEFLLLSFQVVQDLRYISQPFLIDRIIKAIGFEMTTTKDTRDNTQVAYPLLNKDVDGPARKVKWKYRGLIGVLGYLQGTTCSGISIANHQCARFSNDHKLSHEKAAKKIVRYLLDTKDKGIIFRPDF